MALRSGSIRIANDPSKATEWSASMAKAIEDAFMTEWDVAMPGQPRPEINDQMRLLFVAVAKGVVKHLKDNGSAWNVTNSTVNSHTHTATTTISGTIDT